jgi:hypothetical protein
LKATKQGLKEIASVTLFILGCVGVWKENKEAVFAVVVGLLFISILNIISEFLED